jgi:hypothetical protein
LAIGGVLILAGLVSAMLIVGRWAAEDFGALSQVNLAVSAVTTIVIGVQIFFSSFLVSILGLRRSPR